MAEKRNKSDFIRISVILISLVLGVVFILSALTKAIHAGEFVNTVYFGYHLGKLAVLVPIIIFLEFIAGSMLLLQVRVKKVSLFLTGMILAFTAIYLYAHIRYGLEDCNCFGSIKILNGGSLFFFIGRNILLLAMALFLYAFAPDNPAESTKKNILWLSLLLIVFLTGVNYTLPGDFRKVSPSGNRELLSAIQKDLHTEKEGIYMLYFFSYKCPHCINTLGNALLFKSSGAVDSLLVIPSTPDTAILGELETLYHHIPLNAEGSFIEANNLIIRRPTTLFIRNDSIIHQVLGPLPSPYIFMKRYNDIIHLKLKPHHHD